MLLGDLAVAQQRGALLPSSCGRCTPSDTLWEPIMW